MKRIDKLDLIELIFFFFFLLKILLQEWNRVTDWEKIFTKDTSNEGLLLKIQKEFLKLNEKTKNLIKKNWSKTLTDPSFKKIYIWNDVPHHWSSVKCRTKILRYHDTAIRVANIRKADNNQTLARMWRKQGHSFIADENAAVWTRPTGPRRRRSLRK